MSKSGDKIKCSIWSGEMLGVRIGKPNNAKHFKKETPEIIIEINGINCKTNLNSTFWETCPEIRVAKDEEGNNFLNVWIKKNELLPPKLSEQKKGEKDEVILEVVEPYKKFRLSLKK